MTSESDSETYSDALSGDAATLGVPAGILFLFFSDR